MSYTIDCEEYGEEMFLAGERVAPGQYRQVGGSGREITLETEDVLPASLDGRVACYFRVSHRWDQIAERAGERALAGV